MMFCEEEPEAEILARVGPKTADCRSRRDCISFHLLMKSEFKSMSQPTDFDSALSHPAPLSVPIPISFALPVTSLYDAATADSPLKTKLPSSLPQPPLTLPSETLRSSRLLVHSLNSTITASSPLSAASSRFVRPHAPSSVGAYRPVVLDATIPAAAATAPPAHLLSPPSPISATSASVPVAALETAPVPRFVSDPTKGLSRPSPRISNAAASATASTLIQQQYATRISGVPLSFSSPSSNGMSQSDRARLLSPRSQHASPPVPALVIPSFGVTRPVSASASSSTHAHGASTSTDRHTAEVVALNGNRGERGHSSAAFAQRPSDHVQSATPFAQHSKPGGAAFGAASTLPQPPHQPPPRATTSMNMSRVYTHGSLTSSNPQAEPKAPHLAQDSNTLQSSASSASMPLTESNLLSGSISANLYSYPETSVLTDELYDNVEERLRTLSGTHVFALLFP